MHTNMVTERAPHINAPCSYVDAGLSCVCTELLCLLSDAQLALVSGPLDVLAYLAPMLGIWALPSKQSTMWSPQLCLCFDITTELPVPEP